MLPDLPGTEVCRALKREAATQGAAVVMVTAKGEEIDRVVGFELGADDYVVKPFSVRSFSLRVQAICAGAGASNPSRRRSSSDVCASIARRIACGCHNKEVELTALEFKSLATLHDRRNRVQTRGALLSDVWGIDADITTRTVDTHVKRLREKLGDAGEYIETVRGVGYRFADAPPK